ncbi:glycosyltransferase [uncultured Serinicoccus sp.]|uniref:glycosyltransferase n=1 Tax=uncultured Serinicoccus sp. TaxID=735514 RepID=UPI0026055D43|nr:heparinase II/III family protein [uncultured Serinicoccus sp.]
MRLRPPVLLGSAALAVALLGWALSVVRDDVGWIALALVVIGLTVAAVVAVRLILRARAVVRVERRRLRDRLDDVTAELTSVRAELERVGESAGAGARTQALAEERARVHRAWLEALQQRDDGLGAGLEEAKSGVVLARDELRRLGEVQGELSGDLHQLGEMQGALGGDLGTVRRGLEEAGARSDMLADRLGVLDERTADLTAEAAPAAEALDQLRRDNVVLRRKVQAGEDLTAKLAELPAQVEDLRGRLVEEMVLSGRDASRVLTPEEIRGLVPRLIESGRVLALVALSRQVDLLTLINLTQMRAMFRLLRATGYWRLQEQVATAMYLASGNERDEKVRRLVSAELSVFGSPVPAWRPSDDRMDHDRSGPVLHLVGKALPATQTGYTLRTAYTVRAQADLGISVVVVVQPGGDGAHGESDRRFEHDDIPHVALGGPARGGTALDDWLEGYVVALDRVVGERRPSVLHAHSDFLNGAAAVAVGRARGIPVVFESRGFWEESWLSRVGDAWGLGSDPESTLAAVGLPEAYVLRRQAEKQVRAAADAVVTLAEVMREHIEDEHAGETRPTPLRLLPNAVDPSSFVPRGRDAETAADLGIAAGDLVIGYVSSMVEYEGVDLLIDAMRGLRAPADRPGARVHLLLVGDGPVLGQLRLRAEAIDASVVITGRVPHEDVHRYYSLIDIFVVPRRATPVTQLVTPLKPFEALAAGKAVVMSDVRALQEIADQSAAVQTFRAGDAVDLRRRLQDLLDDEDLRRELGGRGREWVVRQRSWDANARGALSLYQELGARWHESQIRTAEEQLGLRGVDPDDVLHMLRENPPPRRGWFQPDGPPDTDGDVMTDGWVRDGRPPIRLDEVSDWSSYAQTDRSWAFHLHSWEFVDSLIRSGTTVSVERACFLATVVLDWVAARDAREASDDPDESMAYYDMALALRAPRLLLVLEALAGHDTTRPAVPVVVRLILDDRDRLRGEDAFTPRTNHGFYSAAAQLHLEKHLPGLPEREEVLVQARERMSLLVQSQFGDDGGHLEHSPDYHRMLLGSFHAAVRDGLIEDQELVARIRRAANVLGWMTQPDGTIVTMGDSPSRPLRPVHAMGDEHTLWIASDGAEGRPEESEMLALPESGYAFVRSPQPHEPGARAASSYLAVQAGFHSRAHKHADDLSFVWYDRGQEICVDGGRFAYGPLLPADHPLRAQGFYYDEPRRQHVESTRAHNALELDGQIQDRRRSPFGSGLVSAEREGSAFAITTRAPYRDYTHRRKLNLVPGRRLIVLDSVHSQLDHDRDAVAWFLLDGSLELLDGSSTGLRFRLPSGDVLQVGSDGRVLDPVRGQESPLRGWRSREENELEPAWSFGVAFDVRTRGGARTELHLECAE